LVKFTGSLAMFTAIRRASTTALDDFLILEIPVRGMLSTRYRVPGAAHTLHDTCNEGPRVKTSQVNWEDRSVLPQADTELLVLSYCEKNVIRIFRELTVSDDEGPIRQTQPQVIIRPGKGAPQICNRELKAAFATLGVEVGCALRVVCKRSAAGQHSSQTDNDRSP
jgi:hypothetical protein